MYQPQQGYSSSGRAMNQGYGQPVGRPQMGMAVGGPHGHYGPQPGMAPTAYPSQQQVYPNQQPTTPTTYPSQQQVVNNQTQPQVVQIVQGSQEFGTKPISMMCQFCKKPITTQVEKSCNCCSCFCCFLTLFIGWFCVQCYRKKEINCCDATHKCPECGKDLGNYTSC